jgi:ATPase family associated with various cellular activities (AAA)
MTRLLDRTESPVAPHAVDLDEVAAVEAAGDAAEEAGTELCLRLLARSFVLSALDVELLLVSLAPDLDSRFEQFYGYLNDDVTRRRPSIGLALTLSGAPVASGPARARLSGHAPLVRGGLLIVEDGDRPFLGRSLRVPDRVTFHLLGNDEMDVRLADVVVDPPPHIAVDSAAAATALKQGVSKVYVRDHLGGTGRSLGAAALREAGYGVLPVDILRLAADPEPRTAVAVAEREARLTHRGLLVASVDATTEAPHQVLRLLMSLAAPVVLVGRVGWDPDWAAQPPLLVDAPTFDAGDRLSLWRSTLDGCLPPDARPEQVTAAYRLSPESLVRAATAARQQSLMADGQVGEKELRAGTRAQNSGGLNRLSRRLEPEVGWDDLVLPAATLDTLREVALRARHRERVLGEWHMRPGGGRGRGVAALFAGDSGTGKTMSAEVVAADLALDLYTVDLATVVDKYVGETEKNLERIFSEAAGVNGVLFFDEADAVFGKRSEVKDAHDRYANIESAYLLQRLESFDGLAILSTNLRANIDDAFTRRLDVVIDFPLPDESLRRRLWDSCLGTVVERSDDLDLDFCAKAFAMSGGSIRSVAVTAAYLAADDDGVLTMARLVSAVQREYRKLGRLRLESEFGPYLPLVR